MEEALSPSGIDIGRVQARNFEMFDCYVDYNSFLWEMVCSDSASSSKFISHDYTRLMSYVKSHHEKLTMISGLNELGEPHTFKVTIDGKEQDLKVIQDTIDAPDTEGRMVGLISDAPYVVPSMQNTNIQYIVNIIRLARNQAITSQSARDTSGIHLADLGRQRDYLNRIKEKAMLYLNSPELDKPKTSPSKNYTNPGNVYGDKGLRDFGSIDPKYISSDFKTYYSMGVLIKSAANNG